MRGKSLTQFGSLIRDEGSTTFPLSLEDGPAEGRADSQTSEATCTTATLQVAWRKEVFLLSVNANIY